jgi:hypothetical protein
MDNYSLAQSFAHLFSHVWKNPSLKNRLEENPRETLLEYGITVPKDVEVEIVENTAKKFYIVLPAPGEQPIRAARRHPTTEDEDTHGQPSVHLLE